jgi:hypothetical protein
MFFNYIQSKHVPADTEVVERGFGGAWFIKMGYAGFNSPANNAFGYETKDKAIAAIKRYQAKSPK